MRDDEPRPVWMSLPITRVECLIGKQKKPILKGDLRKTLEETHAPADNVGQDHLEIAGQYVGQDHLEIAGQ